MPSVAYICSPIREPVGAVRLPEAGWVDVVFAAGGRPVGDGLPEAGHRLAVEHVDPPRLDIAATRRP